MYVVYAKTDPEDSQEAGKVEVLDESGAFNPEWALQEPVVKQELNKSGTFDFKICPPHFYYNQLIKMRTKIWVIQDGVCIFYGRVLYAQKDFTGVKTVHCEGAMSFLLDAVADKETVLAVQKALSQLGPLCPISLSESFDETKIDLTVSDFFTLLIRTYNQKVEEDKRFAIGTVNANRTSTKYNFEVEGNTNFAELIMNTLVEQVGGYIRVRPEFSSTSLAPTKLYIDWMSVLEVDNSQKIRYGVNLLDVSSDESGIELFTILIPTGKQTDSSKPDFHLDSDVFNYETVENAEEYDPESTYEQGDYVSYKGKYYKCKTAVETPEEIDFEKWIIVDTRDFLIQDGTYHVHIDGRRMEILEGIAKYGRIEKAIDISNIDGAQALYDKSIEHLEKYFDPFPEQITLTAIDLRRLDPMIQPLVCGGYLEADVGPLDIHRKLMCCQVTSNLRNPDKDQFVITSDLNDKGDGIPIPSKSTSRGGGGGSGGIGGSGFGMDLSGMVYEYYQENKQNGNKILLGNERRDVDLYMNVRNVAAVMDSMHIEMLDYAGVVDYVPGQDYKAGDLIKRGGKYYRCKADITNPTGEAYSKTAAYNRGDYCTYDGDLYRCIAQDIPAPEEGQEREWNAQLWEKVDPHEYLATEWDQLDDDQKYWSAIDANNKMIQMIVGKTGVEGMEEGEVLSTMFRQTADSLTLASPYTTYNTDDDSSNDISEFDGTKAYAINDLCTYNGRIYKALMNISAPASGSTNEFVPIQWKDVTYFSVIELMKEAIGLEVTDQDTGASSKINLASNRIAMVVGDAATFDPQAKYSVGETVVHEGGLYKCTTAIATPGPWDGTQHWQLIRQNASPGGYIKIENIVDEMNNPATQVKISADKINLSAVNASINAIKNRVGMLVTDENNPSIIRAAIIAAINEDNSSTATIKADKINLEGYVTAAQLSAGTLQTITMSNNGSITTKAMTVNGTLSANGGLVNTSWDSGSYNFFAHSHVIDVTIDNNGVGTVTLGAPLAAASGTDTFNIADTAWYSGRVSAITEAAWADAYGRIDGLDDENTSSNSFTITTPGETPTDPDVTTTFTVTASNGTVNVKNGLNTVVARTTYSAGTNRSVSSVAVGSNGATYDTGTKTYTIPIVANYTDGSTPWIGSIQISATAAFNHGAQSEFDISKLYISYCGSNTDFSIGPVRNVSSLGVITWASYGAPITPSNAQVVSTKGLTNLPTATVSHAFKKNAAGTKIVPVFNTRNAYGVNTKTNGSEVNCYNSESDVPVS